MVLTIFSFFVCLSTIGGFLIGSTFVFTPGADAVPAHPHINLDGSIGGWVAETAFVENTAYLSRNAQVYGDAQVFGNARVFGDVRVFGEAKVSGDAQVFGNAKVSGNAQVYGNALVFGDAKVFGNAWVFSEAWVYGKANISDNDVRVDLPPDPELERLLKEEEELEKALKARQDYEQQLAAINLEHEENVRVLERLAKRAAEIQSPEALEALAIVMRLEQSLL